jgi:hypothetical protein
MYDLQTPLISKLDNFSSDFFLNLAHHAIFRYKVNEISNLKAYFAQGKEINDSKNSPCRRIKNISWNC